MVNLYAKSLLVLSLLFGLLFAIGFTIIYYLEAPFYVAIIFALFVLFLQFLIGPFIIQWLYRISWVNVDAFNPPVKSFILETCNKLNLKVPRLGIIEDGNPNAFTFGHYPGNARVIVTRGLLNMLDDEEVKGVIGHEIGHIIHWDFVVMTLAAAVPLILYIIFRWTVRASRYRSGGSRDKGKGAIFLVMITSYLAYILSQFIVLFLSRVREYYADQFSARVTKNPKALANSLVTIAYGLAKGGSSKEDEKQMDKRRAIKAFGIFDSKVASNLAFASMGSHNFSRDSMVKAMRWDLWNPWAMFYELSSTHPLPAKRIRALDKIATMTGQQPESEFNEKQPESYWDEFLVDFLISNLPLIGLAIGLGLVALNFNISFASLGKISIWGLPIICFGLGLFFRYTFSYASGYIETNVPDLLGKVKVSKVRGIPAILEGEIIGRGIPGLFYSEDLVIKDNKGYMVMDYKQPLGFLDFLFGWLKADKLIGKRVKAIGWYRRSPSPYLEIKKLITSNGEEIKCYFWLFKFIMACIIVITGVVILLATGGATIF